MSSHSKRKRHLEIFKVVAYIFNSLNKKYFCGEKNRYHPVAIFLAPAYKPLLYIACFYFQKSFNQQFQVSVPPLTLFWNLNLEFQSAGCLSVTSSFLIALSLPTCSYLWQKETEMTLAELWLWVWHFQYVFSLNLCDRLRLTDEETKILRD